MRLDELLDVVQAVATSRDRATALATAERSTLEFLRARSHADGFIDSTTGRRRFRIAAYGLITAGDQILLCRLSDAVVDAGRRWTLPGGGLEPSETPRRAAEREILEETGYVAHVGEPVGFDHLHIPAAQTRGRIDIDAIRCLYRGQITRGALTYEHDGSTDRAAWIRQEDLDATPLVDVVDRGLTCIGWR